MKKITIRKVEKLSSELWGLVIRAFDMEKEIINSEITPAIAAEKFDKIITELRLLAELYTDPKP